MKTSYLNFVLKSLSFLPRNENSKDESSLVLSGELAEEAIRIQSHLVWLKCLANYREVLKPKKSLRHYEDSLNGILMKYEGLQEMAKEKVFEEFVSRHGKMLGDVKNEDGQWVIETSKLEVAVSKIMQFNFYAQYKKYLAKEFKESEERVKQLATETGWAVRGTWNSFSGKKKVQKEVVNNDFLVDYTQVELK